MPKTKHQKAVARRRIARRNIHRAPSWMFGHPKYSWRMAFMRLMKRVPHHRDFVQTLYYRFQCDSMEWDTIESYQFAKAPKLLEYKQNMALLASPGFNNYELSVQYNIHYPSDSYKKMVCTEVVWMVNICRQHGIPTDLHRLVSEFIGLYDKRTFFDLEDF
jgi:hypothetical protein